MIQVVQFWERQQQHMQQPKHGRKWVARCGEIAAGSAGYGVRVVVWRGGLTVIPCACVHALQGTEAWLGAAAERLRAVHSAGRAGQARGVRGGDVRGAPVHPG